MDSYSKYEVLPLRRIIYGSNALNELNSIIDEFHCSRAAIVTTRSLANSEILKKISALLGKRVCITFKECKQHTPAESVFKASEAVTLSKADMIITVGGGTVTDTGKAIRFIQSRGIKTSEDLKPFVTKRDKKNNTVPNHVSSLPQIAIPTTLSGSEFTNSCPITDINLKKELYIYRDLIPTVNILDPEATLETPLRLWASSGIKAIDHAVEQIYANKPQEITSTLSYRALELLYKYLPVTKQNPTDLQARKNCQIGAFMAIFGIMNISLGLSHVVGHQIGPKWHLGHGITSCLSLPTVLRFNQSHSLEAQVQMAESIGIKSKETKEDMASEFADRIEHLIGELELPTRMHEVRETRDDFYTIARNVIDDPLLTANPRPVTFEDIMTVLNNAW